jgi:hypothetical protein
MEKCEICGKEFKNLGAHMKAHGKGQGSVATLMVDSPIEDKQLSSLISDIQQKLNRYRNRMDVIVHSENGIPVEVELKARIQVK